MEQSPKKFLLFLDLVGVITCALLILIDLKIKQELLRTAIRLENKIGEAERLAGHLNSYNVSGISDLVSIDFHDDNENHVDTVVEMEDIYPDDSQSDTGPEEIVRQPRGANGRFQARSGQV